MIRRWFRRRGSVLGVKRGFNPNSSSLGFDVSFLVSGIVGISIFTALLSTWIRIRGVQGHGGGSAQEPPE